MGRIEAVLVSHNEHKLRELAAALPDWDLELHSGMDAPAETGSSYYENARTKASHGRRVGPARSWILGEDSGLEVEGLGGAPGIRSSRYAQPGADPIEKLLRELRGTCGRGRRARYVCELVCLAPDGVEFRGTGELEGSIAGVARGGKGFGYDPVFVPLGESRTVAELGDEWKQRHSHRSAAARALLRELEPGGQGRERGADGGVRPVDGAL